MNRLMTCRKHEMMTSEPESSLDIRERLRRRPAFCRSGVRHRGGVNLVEALARNVRPCIAMLREESK
jgi:hypothetical protein